MPLIHEHSKDDKICYGVVTFFQNSYEADKCAQARNDKNIHEDTHFIALGDWHVCDIFDLNYLDDIFGNKTYKNKAIHEQAKQKRTHNI